MKYLCLALLLLSSICHAEIEAEVSVCHDYGCKNETTVVFRDWQLGNITVAMASVATAADERERLGPVLGQLYAWAGEQSPIWRDRGGNYNDDELPGTMDCIDHAATTTRLLYLLSDLGLLRHHRVLTPQYRGRILQHYSAVIEEIDADGHQHADGEEHGVFVVDSWFGDNGTPALVMPIEQWREGGGPDV